MAKKRVMIVGLRANLVDEFRAQLDQTAVELLAGTGADDVRAALAEADIDHVFLGGGLALADRLAAMEAVFGASDRATVHMKDHMSGPEGFVPFVRAVLRGLEQYEPVLSPNAVLRADRSGGTD
jgi:hypothetical protein